MREIFEVNVKKPDSPDIPAMEECASFQQTRFWAEFKAAHGWELIPLDIEISRIDGAKTDKGASSAGDDTKVNDNAKVNDDAKTGDDLKTEVGASLAVGADTDGNLKTDGGCASQAASSNAQNRCVRVFVLVRSFAKGLFSMAYVPMYPSFSHSVSAEEFCGLTEKIAHAIRPHLPKNAMCVRFDPALEFDSVSERDDFVREARRCEGKNGHSLKKNCVDIQPPDTSVVDLERTEEEILSSMKSKWRYNIKLASRKGVEIERVGAQSLSCRAVDSGDEAGMSTAARDELFASLSKKVCEFYEVYRITSARDGIAIHSKRYYLDLLEQSVRARLDGKDVPLVWLYVARHEGDVLGAIMTLVTKREGVYLYGASGNTKRNLMPNFLLQWTAMKDAKGAGAKCYDLYGIPPTDDERHPMHGLFLFKVGFGGKNVHRAGTFDVPLNGFYSVCSLAERARAWWHKTFLKKIRGR